MNHIQQYKDTPRKFSWARLKKNRMALAEKCDFKCQNCGRHIHEPAPMNFPHKESKNMMNVEQKETEFYFTCEELHIYEHRLAKNLEKHPCVAHYIQKYGRTFSPRWPEL
jgi:hypothetical protein